MVKIKRYLAKKPGVVIAFALAGLLASFSAGLDLARGNVALLLSNIAGVCISALFVTCGVKEIVARKK
jgi:hypothetical protein